MSADLFDWNDRSAWLAEIPKYAAGILTSRVTSTINRIRPECWSDNFAWLPIDDGEDQFVNAFASHYRYIRAFHGCRPIDLKSYYEFGLQGQAAEVIEAQFISIFQDVPKSKLREALEDFKDRKGSERGKFWVVLDKDELIEHCGHYLIQGSEYLMALAATLCGVAPGEDYRLRLRTSGTPTIFELHIPTEYLPKMQIYAVARLVLATWGEHTAKRPMGVRYSPCLTIGRTVEPEYLVGHTHPARIRDPHFNRTIYVNKKTKCTLCMQT